jgi:hypothetical protein
LGLAVGVAPACFGTGVYGGSSGSSSIIHSRSVPAAYINTGISKGSSGIEGTSVGTDEGEFVGTYVGKKVDVGTFVTVGVFVASGSTVNDAITEGVGEGTASSLFLTLLRSIRIINNAAAISKIMIGNSNFFFISHLPFGIVQVYYNIF